MVQAYNKWLPPPVADELQSESERFHDLVDSVQDCLLTNTLCSRLNSLQWISPVNTFLKAKSTLPIADVENLVKAALNIVFISSDSLYIQTRWANCLSRVLSKYRKKLKLEIDWRSLYNLILKIHFERRLSYEGLSLKHSHLQNIVYLTETCRRFFKVGSCAEIWSEFRPKLEDISHNSALEAAGFLSLFLSTTLEKKVETDNPFFTRAWLVECLELWSAIPTCHYWNIKWASLLSRCIKHRVLKTSDWEPLLPALFTNFLNAFEVPVGKLGVRSPIYRRIPVEIKRAFDTSWSPGLSTLSAKSIVYLLSPQGSAQSHFDTMVDFLEQYYHPSNGGSWTGSLQRFLRLLVFYFMKRLENECRGSVVNNKDELGQVERAAFVKTVMKVIDRGQYSKNAALAWTAASAAARLSYVEPSLVLPLVVSRFQTAIETVTATHQLESSLRMLALSSRAILLYDATSGDDAALGLKACLAEAMFNTLPGLDANDPPKTIATMQLYCCVLSSVQQIDHHDDISKGRLPIEWSLWVDKFLNQLFALLVNLDPSVQSPHEENAESGMLTERGSPYSCLMELIFSKLTELQYTKALKRTAKFVAGNILPGAIEEVGLLCCNIVSANPKESSVHLIVPIMESLMVSFTGSPQTGFGGSNEELPVADFKVGLSPALEMMIRYYLGILAKAIFYCGAALLPYKSLLQEVILASFNAPSSKVNDAGCNLLTSAVGSMTLFYPVKGKINTSVGASMDGYEEWVSAKNDENIAKQFTESLWHIPSSEEISFVEEIVDAHLRKPLANLKKICEEKDGYKSMYAGQEKEHLRVLLLRVEGTLCGLGSCLPDFDTWTESERAGCLTVVGAAGATVGTSGLREETARIIHQLCEYILKYRGDDSILLRILISIIDLVGNYGSLEYHSYLRIKGDWDEGARLLTEPCTNFINNSFSSGKRRPWWLVVERAFVHNLWRASQSGYRCFKKKEIGLPIPSHIIYLLNDLLNLSLHGYSSVRSDAGRNLKNMLQRYPPLVKKCMPLLTKTLQDPKATKESALGSCEILMSRPVLRHLRQDWTGLASFLLALLGSAHHESVEAQDAINELFIVFNTSFGGVPVKAYACDGDKEGPESMTYSSMIVYVRDLLKGDSIAIHWRYNLMAHGILLFLVLPVTGNEKPSEDIICDLRYSVAGGFLNNLKSELPPLRPLSVIALLFLLEATPRWDSKHYGSKEISSEEVCVSKGNGFLSENCMASVLEDENFGENVVSKLAIDRQAGDEDEYSTQTMSDAGLTAFMPMHMREWPHTRTWEADTKGDQFSPTFAKLFKRLVQKFGSVVLKILHGPLEEVSNASDDRGKQCIAAEIMAGLLHSDAECVLAAWDDWIAPLFQKFLVLPTLDTASEWAACIRFAVGGKGRTGSRMPLLRLKVLHCVANAAPRKSSTTLIARKIMFLRAALVELLPAYSSAEEMAFQLDVLKQIWHLLSHSSPQVRRSVGGALCLLLSNMHLYSLKHKGSEKMNVEHVCEETCLLLVMQSLEATKAISNADPAATDGSPDGSSEEDESQKKKIKEAVRQMETVFYFLSSAIRSGRANILVDAVVRLIYPTLALQETSEKDLSSLARMVMRYMQWQPFPASHLSQVVEVVLTASQDNYWHTRVAFLTFLQAFMYRHRFILSSSDQKSLWDKVVMLLSDPQLEVREAAARTLSGMMKGAEETFARPFRQSILHEAALVRRERINRLNGGSQAMPRIHGIVLGLSTVILSVPYDMPSWLPEMVMQHAEFSNQPWPIRATVTKTIRDFRHTHSDMWEFQKNAFTEEQLEALSNLTSSATYFA